MAYVVLIHLMVVCPLDSVAVGIDEGEARRR